MSIKKAPKLEGKWINKKPKKLKNTILIQFWAYGCANCLRTIPHMKKIYEKYAKKGIDIIGIHTPEFEFEKNIENLKTQIKRLGIEYPVLIDNEMEIWNAIGNKYWPTSYIIENGEVIFEQIGEGEYEKLELMIQKLLGTSIKTEKNEPIGYMFDQSPNTYAGFIRNGGLGSGLICDKNGCRMYVDPGNHLRNIIYPAGEWVQEKEYLELVGKEGKISYKFYAREVNITMGSNSKETLVEIYLDGKKYKKLKIDKIQNHLIWKNKEYKEKELTILFKGKAKVYSLTFG